MWPTCTSSVGSTKMPSSPSGGGWAFPLPCHGPTLMGLWAPAPHQDGAQLPRGQGTKTGWQRSCNHLIYSDYLIYNDGTVTQSVQS